MANQYIDLKHAFKYLECASRQKDMVSRCKGLPKILAGRNPESGLRDYIHCLMLVTVIAQLESDIEQLRDIPLLHRTDMLAPRLIILRNHFQIESDVYSAVDGIRQARNLFVHEGQTQLNAGYAMAEVPGRIVTFLQRCQHPNYR